MTEGHLTKLHNDIKKKKQFNKPWHICEVSPLSRIQNYIDLPWTSPTYSVV